MESQNTQLRTTERITFTDSEVALIKSQIAKNATPDEFALFLYQCKRTGLDPLARQMYCIHRGGKMTIQTSIDGFRVIAERSGDYAGQSAPEFLENENGIVACKVTVYRFRGDQRYPAAVGVAYWSEYCAGGPMWQKMPHTMISKCFDGLTEVLTDKGFERFGSVTGRVLQVTDRGLEATDAKPFFQYYEGDMVTLDSDDLNFSVTPNHDMITTDGKIEAGELYGKLRSRPAYYIPRCVTGSNTGGLCSENIIALAAAAIADGAHTGYHQIKIAVSRPYKVAFLRELGLHTSESAKRDAGRVSGGDRPVITKSDKVQFNYRSHDCDWIIDEQKNIKTEAILGMSMAQARVFVDTLILFDGHTTKNNIRRFYTSRLDHMKAFELACVVAGYAVSPIRTRTSDLSDKVGYYVTISTRSEIPLVRWGREYKGEKNAKRKHTGVELTESTGIVWCVTVPSGEIIVRRNGFSMRCGNCAEALALRKAYPQDLSGLYTQDEMQQAEAAPEGQETPITPHTEIKGRTPEQNDVNDSLQALPNLNSSDKLKDFIAGQPEHVRKDQQFQDACKRKSIELKKSAAQVAA